MKKRKKTKEEIEEERAYRELAEKSLQEVWEKEEENVWDEY